MFFEENEKTPFVVMYRQYDGYLDGHGQELVDFLQPRKLINGIERETSAKAANGMGCLAAQAVSYFKGDKIGDIYLHGYDPKYYEDYTYEVRPGKKGGYDVRVLEWNKEIFSGTVDQLDKFIGKKAKKHG
jgi:hypothetical protein